MGPYHSKKTGQMLTWIQHHGEFFFFFSFLMGTLLPPKVLFMLYLTIAHLSQVCKKKYNQFMVYKIGKFGFR